jgi:hypothetical protein
LPPRNIMSSSAHRVVPWSNGSCGLSNAVSTSPNISRGRVLSIVAMETCASLQVAEQQLQSQSRLLLKYIEFSLSCQINEKKHIVNFRGGDLP